MGKEALILTYSRLYVKIIAYFHDDPRGELKLHSPNPNTNINRPTSSISIYIFNDGTSK